MEGAELRFGNAVTAAGPVHLACCFDRAYVLPTAVMATSLLAHSSPERRYVLHLVYDGTDDAPLRGFKGFRRTPLEVRLVKAPNAFAGIPTAYPGMPPVSFLRLALGDLLPDVGRVLSLDPDTLCLSDVAEVYDMPLGGSPLGAVADLSLAAKLAAEDSQGAAAAPGSDTMYLERQLGLDRPARSAYFNAGVLLLDLERLRADALPARALTFLQQSRDPLRWSEQCVLNAFYARLYRQLPARWNAMLHPGRLAEYEPGGIALLKRVAQAWAEPAILHFNWTAKPWIAAAIPTPWFSTWWAYLLAAPLSWRKKLGPPSSRRRLLEALFDRSVHAQAKEIRALLAVRQGWWRQQNARSGNAAADQVGPADLRRI